MISRARRTLFPSPPLPRLPAVDGVTDLSSAEWAWAIDNVPDFHPLLAADGTPWHDPEEAYDSSSWWVYAMPPPRLVMHPRPYLIYTRTGRLSSGSRLSLYPSVTET